MADENLGGGAATGGAAASTGAASTAATGTTAAAAATGSTITSTGAATGATTGATGDTGGAAAQRTWRESNLIGDYATDPVFKNFENGEDLLRSYKHAQSMIGMPPDQVLKKPGVDATPQEWDKYHEFNGRPKAAKDYTPPTLPEGQKWNDAVLTKFQDAAFKAGVSNEAFKGIIDWYKSEQASTAAAHEAAKTESINSTTETMKKEWGAAYDQTYGDVNRLLGAFGEEGLKKELRDLGVEGNPKVLRFLAKIASQFSEGGALGQAGGGNAAGRAMGATQAQTMIREKNSDKAFMAKYNSGDAHAMAEMTRLYEFAYPETKKAGAKM